MTNDNQPTKDLAEMTTTIHENKIEANRPKSRRQEPMTTKYTVRITELRGSGPQPQITAFVAAESIEEAVRKAGDRYACHTAPGIDYEVQVFVGERGWYHPDQCVWRGRVVFSQCRDSQFQMHEASS